MKTPKFILACCFLASTFLSLSQTTPAEKPFIEVTGTAEKEVVPDKIYISIVVRERFENKEKITVEAQEEKLKAAIKGLGIDLSNLSLADANANFMRVKWNGRDLIAQKEYSLLITDAKTLGAVFKELDQLDIKDAYIYKVDHSQIEAFKKEVRIAAIKAAKEKADYLLLAIGEQTGKALVVTETPQINYTTTRSNFRFEDEAYRSYSGKSEQEEYLDFKKIVIAYSIYTKFEIK